MFRELMKVWKGKTFLSEIIKDYEGMLERGEQIFTTACAIWEGTKEASKERDGLFLTDQKINSAEQKIRRRLIEHLSINPGVDTPACFVFITVVKDAERIGDYAKNIFELDALGQKKCEKGEEWQCLNELKQKISANFSLLRLAFAEADAEKANQIMRSHREIGKGCENLIREMVKKELRGSETICYTLLSRYFKRVSAHLANIASAIVNPVEKIDFVTEGML